MADRADIAVVGMAVMGQNLAMNIADNGYKVVAYNRTTSKVDDFLAGPAKGMKNVMGVIGGNRGQIHTGFDDKIVDLNLARPSTLTVLDATRILTAHGPQGGRLEDVKEVNTVVAGSDVVAVDAYATRFFGLKPKEIGHIRRAAERGLGTMDLDRVNLREEAL